MVQIKRKNMDGLVITHWTFEKIDDAVPMHNHLPEDDHISILVKGKIYAFGRGWDMTLDTPGDIINFLPNHPHEFKALEADSILVNIRKGRIAPEDMHKFFDVHSYTN